MRANVNCPVEPCNYSSYCILTHIFDSLTMLVRTSSPMGWGQGCEQIKRAYSVRRLINLSKNNSAKSPRHSFWQWHGTPVDMFLILGKNLSFKRSDRRGVSSFHCFHEPLCSRRGNESLTRRCCNAVAMPVFVYLWTTRLKCWGFFFIFLFYVCNTWKQILASTLLGSFFPAYSQIIHLHSSVVNILIFGLNLQYCIFFFLL